LNEWFELINGLLKDKEKRKIIEGAKRIIADAVIEILTRNRLKEVYKDILNEILYSIGNETDEHFVDAIPLAIRPSDGLRFCLIRADGDSIGSWINGELGVPWVLMHHPTMIPNIQKLKNISPEILMRPRPTSPAYFSTLSMVLSYNALLISKIIEAFGGFLIFTGGDDVLAIVPPEIWHLVYLILRFTFSSEILLNPTLKRYSEGIYSYGMSWRATQSYGVVIAHHKADFRWVINMSRELEEKSKKFQMYTSNKKIKDKDAISVALLSRGSVIRCIEPIPNVLIPTNSGLLTIREFDHRIINNVQKNALSPDISDDYEHHFSSLLCTIRSKNLGGDFAFIGIIPQSTNLITTNSTSNSSLSLVAYAYKMARYVSRGILSREGLIILEQFYEKFKNKDDAKASDADFYLLKYQIKRKIPSDKYKFLADNLSNDTRLLYELSEKTSSNLLSIYSLTEVFRRCLNNCIVR